MSEQRSSAESGGILRGIRGKFFGWRGKVSDRVLQTYLETDVTVAENVEAQRGKDQAELQRERLAKIQAITEARPEEDNLGRLARAARNLQFAHDTQGGEGHNFGSGDMGFSGTTSKDNIPQIRLASRVTVRDGWPDKTKPGDMKPENFWLSSGIGPNPLLTGGESSIDSIRIIRQTRTPVNPEDPAPGATIDDFSVAVASTQRTSLGVRQYTQGIHFSVDGDGRPTMEMRQSYIGERGERIAPQAMDPENIDAFVGILETASQHAERQAQPPETA